MEGQSWKTKGARLLLTLLSVLFCNLSLPGNPLPVLAGISLVPLGLAIHGASRVQSLAYSFVFGFFGWFTSTRGLAIGLSSYMEPSSFVEVLLYLVAFSAYLAAPYGLFGLSYGVFQWMKYPMGSITTAACLTVLVSCIPTPLPVTPAHSLYVFPVFIQILDLGGEPLLLFALCLFNWLFVDLILRIRRHQSLKRSVASMLLLCALVTAYGHFRLNQLHQEEADGDKARIITVAAVQPNIPLPGRPDARPEELTNPLGTILGMSEDVLAANPDVELVVWPETPITIDCARDSDALQHLTNIVARYKTPFLINCVEERSLGGSYNTALLVSGSGEILSYRKRKLFPFVEYLPGERRFPVLRKIMPGAAMYVPGKEAVVFRIKEGWFVFPVICYEVLFADEVRGFIEKGGNILVNPTNDAWFGKSRVPDVLISSSIYQAVEYRVPLIRVSNSGNSLFVKASGEVVPHSRTANFKRTTTVDRVFVPEGRSPYFYFGNIFLYALTLLVGIEVWRGRYANR